MESSLAFYDKVVDIWYKFLASVRADASLAKNVGEAQLSEGMDMLTRVLNTRVNLLGETHIATVGDPAGSRLCYGTHSYCFMCSPRKLRELFGRYNNYD